MKYTYLIACVFTLHTASVSANVDGSSLCANPDDFNPTHEFSVCDDGDGDNKRDCEEKKPTGRWTSMSCGTLLPYLEQLFSDPSNSEFACDPNDSLTHTISYIGGMGCCGIGKTMCDALTGFDAVDVCKDRDTADLEQVYGECEGGRENVPRNTRRECKIARGTWVTRTCAEGLRRNKMYLESMGADPTSEDFCSSPSAIMMNYFDKNQCCGAPGNTKCSSPMEPADLCENRSDFNGAKIMQGCSDERAHNKRDCKRRKGEWEVHSCSSLGMDVISYASMSGVDFNDELSDVCRAIPKDSTYSLGSLLTHGFAAECCEGGRSTCSDTLNEPKLSDVCAVPSDFDANAMVVVDGDRKSCADAARSFTQFAGMSGIDVNNCSATIDLSDDDDDNNSPTNLAGVYAYMIPPQCCGESGQRKCGTPYPESFGEIICENPEEFASDKTVGFCNDGPNPNFYKKKSECRNDWSEMTCEDRARFAFDQFTYGAKIPFDQATCGAVFDTPWGKQHADNLISKYLAPKCCKPACSSKKPRNCRDDRRWRGKRGTTCKWVAEDPKSRCRMRGNKGRAFDFCPRSCNTCRDD